MHGCIVTPLYPRICKYLCSRLYIMLTFLSTSFVAKGNNVEAANFDLIYFGQCRHVHFFGLVFSMRKFPRPRIEPAPQQWQHHWAARELLSSLIILNIYGIHMWPQWLFPIPHPIKPFSWSVLSNLINSLSLTNLTCVCVGQSHRQKFQVSITLVIV